MKRVLLYPFLIMLFVIAVIILIAWMAPTAKKEVVEIPLPAVRVQTIEPEPFQFRVDAQGTVVPRREGDLRPQISGEVIWVSPALVAGGFFEEGEVLLRIDPTDYEARVESEEAALARADSEARRAGKELKRQRSLADRSVASQARIDDAENAARVSQAVLREARSRLGQARRDLERTELRAPYAGRVRRERVDPGQFVSRGESLVDLYAVDFAEVRLPIPDRELSFMDLPLGYREVDREEEEGRERQADAHLPRVRSKGESEGRAREDLRERGGYA